MLLKQKHSITLLADSSHELWKLKQNKTTHCPTWKNNSNGKKNPKKQKSKDFHYFP